MTSSPPPAPLVGHYSEIMGCVDQIAEKLYQLLDEDVQQYGKDDATQQKPLSGRDFVLHYVAALRKHFENLDVYSKLKGVRAFLENKVEFENLRKNSAWQQLWEQQASQERFKRLNPV